MNLGRVVGYVVFAHRIDHQVKHLAGLNQLVDKAPHILRMYVIIVSPMDKEQAAMEILGALEVLEFRLREPVEFSPPL